MLNTIIVHEQASGIKLIQQYCLRIDFVQLQKTFRNPIEAIRYLKKYPVDVVVIDYSMQGMSWVHFISMLPPDTIIICLINSSQPALEGLIRQAVYYLIQPVSFENFYQALKMSQDFLTVTNQKQGSKKKYIYLRVDYGLKKVDINDILYIEALDDYLKIHLDKAKVIVVKMTMKKILEKLEMNEFIRVHRSYIVPLGRITNIRKKTIYLSGVEIPIGLSYQQDFKKTLDK